MISYAIIIRILIYSCIIFITSLQFILPYHSYCQQTKDIDVECSVENRYNNSLLLKINQNDILSPDHNEPEKFQSLVIFDIVDNPYLQAMKFTKDRDKYWILEIPPQKTALITLKTHCMNKGFHVKKGINYKLTNYKLTKKIAAWKTNAVEWKNQEDLWKTQENSRILNNKIFNEIKYKKDKITGKYLYKQIAINNIIVTGTERDTYLDIKELALNKGIREANEQVNGINIKSLIKVENGVAVEDTIYAQLESESTQVKHKKCTKKLISDDNFEVTCSFLFNVKIIE